MIGRVSYIGFESISVQGIVKIPVRAYFVIAIDKTPVHSAVEHMALIFGKGRLDTRFTVMQPDSDVSTYQNADS